MNQVVFGSAFNEIEPAEKDALTIPEPGSYGLRILSPTLLELTLIQTKEPDPARFLDWDFVGSNFLFTSPAASEFTVKVGSTTIGVNKVGFKRRPIYAPLKQRDLRVASQLYLELNSGIAEGGSVEVTNPNGRLWKPTLRFSSVLSPNRFSPALHVNQVGYQLNQPKQAMVGYYLGSLGEMKFNVQAGFRLVNSNGAAVYQGPLTHRADKGFSYSPAPYQFVFQADFSSFNIPGAYRLMVPELGVSLPFIIGDGIAATYARTFALGLYHQRCGTANSHPYTRHTHEACHTNDVYVPTSSFQKVQEFLNTVATETLADRQTAPLLTNLSQSLYPFVRKEKVNVSGGHHDAGDYSKYTINSAGMIHSLVFAADAFPGVADLDNLGLPESGDGKSDIIQEAKWEADFLAKMQDSDGGFYFLVYPKDRRYEDDVTPDKGDPQVVWPKTTSVTAAAVAALAEAGSSPVMKRQFPLEASLYLNKAKAGWNFLIQAVSNHGKDGSYQKLTHYGNEFIHDDELAWAAAALYAATGEAVYHQKLIEWLPDPNDPNTRRWSWWKMFEGYGNAIRTYAFAARTGRLAASKLNPNYLAKCEIEILGAGDDHVRFSNDNAYGTSFPDTNKQYRSAGWYFSSERAFDVTTAYQIEPKAEYATTVIANWNYESGVNPVNMTFITGIGYRRQRDVVHQTSQNDHQLLPPTGLPQGNIQPGFAYLYPYKGELGRIPFPPDGATTGPYPYYDRWADSFNTTCEFVVMDLARSLGSVAFWMAQSPKKDQEWRPKRAEIIGLPQFMPVGAKSIVTLSAPGVELTDALVTWEVKYLEPGLGTAFTFSPKFIGEHWIEAEALLPDGRRVFASGTFTATTPVTMPPNSFQSVPLTNDQDMVVLYHMDHSLADSTHRMPALRLEGNARLDEANLGWMSQRAGSALRFFNLGDKATISLPASALLNGSETEAITIEAMIYINEFKGYNQDRARIISLTESWNSYMELIEDKYAGPFVQGGINWSFSSKALVEALTPKEWHHMSISLSKNGYVLKFDGVVYTTLASRDLLNWGKAATANLEIGNFDGWIDEVAVRSIRSKREDGTSPVVTLTSPESLKMYSFPARIPMAALTQTSHSISKVEFFAGNTKVGEDSTAPFEFLWEGAPIGSHVITAKVVEISGTMGVSGRSTVTVMPPPEMVATPSINPTGATFTGRVTVEMRCLTPGATIRYTVNGSAPTASSPVYNSPIIVTKTSTLKVQATKEGMLPSPVVTKELMVVPQEEPNQAKFIGYDTATMGSWRGVFGTEGYSIHGDRAVSPVYAQTTVIASSSFTWSQHTTETRALLNGTGSTRIAMASYSKTALDINVAVNDMKIHKFSIYLVDWDRAGRVQLLEAIDSISGQVLDSRIISNFEQGVYVIYEVAGDFTFRITSLSGPNAVVMGTFFDPVTRLESPKLVPLGFQGSSTFNLQITGLLGAEYEIQASDDMISWRHIGSVMLKENTALFQDTTGTATPGRFYKAFRL